MNESLNKVPKVSILIPYYNDQKFLRQSINSVLSQTYKDFELVLINHASTDASRKLAHIFIDERIKHIDMPCNEGAGGGLIFESFLSVAKGEYYKIFCADDVMQENYLEIALKFFNENPSVDFLFSDADYIDDKGKKTGESWATHRSQHIFDSNDVSLSVLEDYYFSWASNIPFPTLMFKKECFSKIFIDYTHVMHSDVSLILGLLLSGKKLGCIKKALVSYRIHKNQMSSTRNELVARNYSFFEGIAFFSMFLETQNIEILGKLLRSGDTDIDNLHLAIAIYFLTTNHIPRQIAAYLFLHAFFNTPDGRKKAVQIGFPVGRFRYFLRNNCCIGKFYHNEINDMGIKGIIRVLAQKIKYRIFKKKLSHL